jgi:hypothetical protein
LTPSGQSIATSLPITSASTLKDPREIVPHLASGMLSHALNVGPPEKNTLLQQSRSTIDNRHASIKEHGTNFTTFTDLLLNQEPKTSRGISDEACGVMATNYANKNCEGPIFIVGINNFQLYLSSW